MIAIGEVTHSWIPVIGVVGIARKTEGGELECRELRAVQFKALRRLQVKQPPAHGSSKYCIVGHIVCLN